MFARHSGRFLSSAVRDPELACASACAVASPAVPKGTCAPILSVCLDVPESPGLLTFEVHGGVSKLLSNWKPVGARPP